MPEDKPFSAMDKAMRLLSHRALSAAELAKKLLQAQFPQDEVELAVNECKRRRFIDDELLAADYVELLRQRNTGSRMIRQKLIRRGLKEQLAEGIPEEDSNDAELNAARRALDYKWRLLNRESDARKKREKAFRFMAGRGFAPGIIFKVLDEISQAENDF